MKDVNIPTVYQRQAQYNTWMNENIYSACKDIPDEQRKKDLKAFFHSIHGTLNHLLLGDRAWMGRFLNKPVKFESLNQELYSDFDILWRQRKQTDQDIEAWVNSLSDDKLATPLSYVSMSGNTPMTLRLSDAVLHLFHHQTHHRGQVTTLINQLGYDFGETDIPLMPGVTRE